MFASDTASNFPSHTSGWGKLNNNKLFHMGQHRKKCKTCTAASSYLEKEIVQPSNEQLEVHMLIDRRHLMDPEREMLIGMFPHFRVIAPIKLWKSLAGYKYYCKIIWLEGEDRYWEIFSDNCVSLLQQITVGFTFLSRCQHDRRYEVSEVIHQSAQRLNAMLSPI